MDNLDKTSEDTFREELRERAGAWRDRMEAGIQRVLDMPDTTRNDVLRVLWEEGILGRIAPQSEEELDARKKLEKAVWDGSRDDPDLYWRIMYAAGHAREGSIRRWSVMGTHHGYLEGTSEGIASILASKRCKELFPVIHDEQGGYNVDRQIYDFFIERARQELRSRGVDPHDNLIPWGSEGVWNGISVIVDGYTEDGLLSLRGATYEDHVKMYPITHGNGVLPSEINPQDFHLP